MKRREVARDMASLVEELQAQALDESVSIDRLLRKAKVVSEKLDIHRSHQY